MQFGGAMPTPEEWDLLGNVIRSEERHLQPLQALCVDKIIHCLPLYMLVKPRKTFSCLPTTVMTKLMAALSEKPFLLAEQPWRVYRLFLSWNTQVVKVDMYQRWRVLGMPELRDFESPDDKPWFMKAWTRVEALRFLKALWTCKKSLLHLELTGLPCVHKEIHQSLFHLKKLQVLILKPKDFKVNDHTLKVIGKNLPQLRELSIGENVVTDRGLKYLWVEDGGHGKCKNLTSLQFPYPSSNISVEGLLCALENLPNLVKFSDPRLMYKAVLLFHQKYGSSRTLKVTEKLRIGDDSTNTVISTSNEDLAKFIKTSPNLGLFFVTYTPEIDVRMLLQADRIESVGLLHQEIDNNFICDFGKKLGTTLRFLTVTGNFKIDISVIGHFCPNLKNFNWECCPITKYKYDISNQFKNIEQFLLYDGYGQFPSDILKVLFNSEKLESVDLCSVANFTEQFMDKLFEDVIADRKILSSLRKFCVASDFIDLEHMKNLVRLCPKLNSVFANGRLVDREANSELQDFMEGWNEVSKENKIGRTKELLYRYVPR